MEFPITRNIQTNSSLELTTGNKCPSSGYSKQLEFCPSKLFRPISAFLDDSALCLHCHVKMQTYYKDSLTENDDF